MPTPPVNPFPFPAGYFRDPNHVLEARSMRDYVKIFLSRRAERPGGRFHDVDISELLRLAEDVGAVHKFEIAYIRKLTRIISATKRRSTGSGSMPSGTRS